MIDIDVEKMWKSTLTDEFYDFSPADQMQLKIVFYSGVHSMIHANSMLHSLCDDKSDYVANLKKLHDECIDFEEVIEALEETVNELKEPKKPKLKIVENNACNAPKDGIS